jgi:SMC interacting uncharacterized protein involved in chromosome segregation
MAVMMPLFSGCQRAITAEQVQAAAAEVNDLNVQLGDYQQKITELAQSVADVNLIDAATLEKIQQLNAEADSVRTKIGILTAALANVQITGDDNQDLLNLLSQLNAASAPFNPYAAPTAGVLSIISLILGLLAKKKSAEAKQSGKALDEVVTANELFLNTAANEEENESFKNIQGQIQTAATNRLVAEIKAS